MADHARRNGETSEQQRQEAVEQVTQRFLKMKKFDLRRLSGLRVERGGCWPRL